MEEHGGCDSKQECPVCLEVLTEDDKPVGRCGHIVHLNCIVQWGKAQCPLCRTEIQLPPSLENELNIVKRRREQEQYTSDAQVQEEEYLQAQEEMFTTLFDQFVSNMYSLFDQVIEDTYVYHEHPREMYTFVRDNQLGFILRLTIFVLYCLVGP